MPKSTSCVMECWKIREELQLKASLLRHAQLDAAHKLLKEAGKINSRLRDLEKGYIDLTAECVKWPQEHPTMSSTDFNVNFAAKSTSINQAMDSLIDGSDTASRKIASDLFDKLNNLEENFASMAVQIRVPEVAPPPYTASTEPASNTCMATSDSTMATSSAVFTSTPHANPDLFRPYDPTIDNSNSSDADVIIEDQDPIVSDQDVHVGGSKQGRPQTTQVITLHSVIKAATAIKTAWITPPTWPAMINVRARRTAWAAQGIDQPPAHVRIVDLSFHPLHAWMTRHNVYRDIAFNAVTDITPTLHPRATALINYQIEASNTWYNLHHFGQPGFLPANAKCVGFQTDTVTACQCLADPDFDRRFAASWLQHRRALPDPKIPYCTAAFWVSVMMYHAAFNALDCPGIERPSHQAWGRLRDCQCDGILVGDWTTIAPALISFIN